MLSDDPTFGTGVTTLSYAPGNQVWGFSDEFDAVDARYARFQVTAADAANSGMQEIIFYAIPEPSTSVALLGGLGLFAFARRRR